MSARRITALALSGALLAGGTGVALAAVTKDDGERAEQAILDDAAKRLDIAPDKLREALLAAQAAHLDRAVKTGKLTQQQAEELKARRSKSGRVFPGPLGGPPGFKGHGPPFGPHHGARGAIVLDLSKALGITRAQLREQLHDGKSVADIAKAQGKSLDDVRASLTTGAKARADKAVKAGDLTKAQADKMLSHLDEALEHLAKAPMIRRHKHGEGPPDLHGDGPPKLPGKLRPGADEAPALEPPGVFS